MFVLFCFKKADGSAVKPAAVEPVSFCAVLTWVPPENTEHWQIEILLNLS